MGGRIFSLDAVTKSVETFHYDESTGHFTIEDKQEVTDLVDLNHAIRGNGVDRKAFQRKIGSVPENIYWYWQTKWKNEGRSREEIRALWIKFLNDPDHKDFKTIDGRA
jgi:hypothetical protein